MSDIDLRYGVYMEDDQHCDICVRAMATLCWFRPSESRPSDWLPGGSTNYTVAYTCHECGTLDVVLPWLDEHERVPQVKTWQLGEELPFPPEEPNWWKTHITPNTELYIQPLIADEICVCCRTRNAERYVKALRVLRWNEGDSSHLVAYVCVACADRETLLAYFRAWVQSERDGVKSGPKAPHRCSHCEQDAAVMLIAFDGVTRYLCEGTRRTELEDEFWRSAYRREHPVMEAIPTSDVDSLVDFLPKEAAHAV